jgi:hypothetical protein
MKEGGNHPQLMELINKVVSKSSGSNPKD